MRIASYNVNSVHARLPVLLRWLTETQPDVACLQELKTPTEKFPLAEIEAAGYQAIWLGQKSWNGVAIIAKKELPLQASQRGLPGMENDEQSRFLQATVKQVTIGCLYLPNGNPVPGPKFEYKLTWMMHLQAHAQNLINQNKPAILVGDYNVIPTHVDAYKAERWVDDALFRPETRAAFELLLSQGWTDALRHLHPQEIIYTYWDYFRNAFGRNAGLRIDHFLVSPPLLPQLRFGGVDKQVRGWEKTSDHAPVWIELEDAGEP